MSNRVPMNLICPLCERLLLHPVRLQCGHSQCRSCTSRSTTEPIACARCGQPSLQTEIFEDREMESHIRQLPVRGSNCTCSSLMRDYQEHTEEIDSSSENANNFSQQLYQNTIQCTLHQFGCTNEFQPCQLQQHYSSQMHKDSDASKARSLLETIQKLTVDLQFLPPTFNSVSKSQHNELLNATHIFYELIKRVFQLPEPSNAGTTSSDASSQTSSISGSSDEDGRQTILNADKNRYQHLDKSLLLAQLKASEDLRGKIPFRNESANSIKQKRQSLDFQQPPAKKVCQEIASADETRQAKSEETPISSRITNTYQVNDAGKKLDYLLNKNDSIIFDAELATATNLIVQLSAQDVEKSPVKSLFLSAQLKDPDRGLFHGSIKFILLDQSATGSPNHITKEMTGELNNANKCLSSDGFISVDQLRAKGNRFIVNDHMRLSIEITHRNEEKTVEQPMSNQHTFIQHDQIE